MTNSLKKRMLIVDASSFLYRAYHALPDLRSKKGHPTGALYGIINMLKKVRLDWPSQIGACVFDPKGPTFRDKIFSDYKATRSSMPEDLSLQITPIFEVVKALGWPFIQVSGYEADDVIGTLVCEARKKNLGSVIISGDKDLTQLVNEDVILVDTMSRHGGSGKIFDIASVVEKFGVAPDKIIDYLTLVGDQSDNIPGVRKVGAKTAVKLLNEYGSINQIFDSVQNISGAVGKNLQEAKDWIPLGKKLVTIKTDCPDLDDFIQDMENKLKWLPTDVKKISDIKVKYDLGRIFKDFLEPDGSSVDRHDSIIGHANYKKEITENFKKNIKLNYRTIYSLEELDELIKVIDEKPIVAFDTETTSLNVREAALVGISLSWDLGCAAYIPIGHVHDLERKQLELEPVLKALKPWFADKKNTKLAHNLKYDQHILENHGILLNGNLHDTLLQSYVLEAHRRHDLESLALRFLNRKGLSYDELTGTGKKRIGFEQVPIELASKYSCEDSDFTLDLHNKLYPALLKDDALLKVYREIELPSLEVLKIMESDGIYIDKLLLAKQTKELANKIFHLENQAHGLAGRSFNLGSPKQIGEVLFGDLDYKPIKKTASGAASTDESVLERLAENYPLPKVLLEWRTLSKLKSTYTDKLPKMIDPSSLRVHTTFSQATAVTGRLSSSDPNLQNIPVKTEEGRKIRAAFIAGKSTRIVSADYSQIELRIMAHLSDDKSLITAFENSQDVHSATAAEIFGVSNEKVTPDQRRTAKVINFGLIYGMSPFGLSKNLGITIDAAKSYIDKYFTRYPMVARFMENTKDLAKKNGYVQTVFGRKLWLPEINSPNGPRRQASERAAINAPMQGTAADLIKMAMINMHGAILENRFQSKMVLQVHDELVFETPNNELEDFCNCVKVVMCSVAKLKVPLLVDVGNGQNWEQAH